MTTRLPSPGFWGALVNFQRLLRSPLALFERLANRYGPVVRLRIAWVSMVVVNEAGLARRILQLPHSSANKNTRSVRLLTRVCGESVLTSNGESWFRHRRLVQPAFHHQQIAGFLPIMARALDEVSRHWKTNEPFPPLRAMTDLAFSFICDALFSVQAGEESSRLRAAIDTVMDCTWRTMRSPSQYPLRLPTPTRRRFRQGLAEIDQFLYDLIAHRRNEALGSRQDLLDLLMATRDADDGMGMSDEEIRNEAITFLIAGHETTANALAWALLLLAKNPVVQAKARAEVATISCGHPLSLKDLPKLEFVRAIFLESMRLYPPIWLIERNLEAPLEEGQWQLPAGTQVLICPYVLHRSEDQWSAPGEFRPERFLAPESENNPAFLPFGAGPRTCIGRNLALMEGTVFLALLLQRYQFTSSGTEHPWIPYPGISLRPPADVSLSWHPAAD